MNVIRYFVFASLVCTHSSTLANFDNSTPDEILNSIKAVANHIREICESATPDSALLRENVEKAKKLTHELSEHPESTQDQKSAALDLQFNALRRIVRIYRKDFFSDYVAIIHEIVTTSAGSDRAASAELDLIDLDAMAVPGLCIEAFLSRMKTYAEKYPTYPVGAFFMSQYAKRLSSSGDKEKARHVLTQGLGFYPNNKILVGEIAMLEMPGTMAKLSTKLLSGDSFDIESQKGKVVLLDFWATWCGPCKQMTPFLKTLKEKYSSKGLEIVGFSLDRNIDALKTYVEAHALSWIQLYEPKVKTRQEIMDAHHVWGIPTLFVIDRAGTFAAVGLNDAESIEVEVRRALGIAR